MTETSVTGALVIAFGAAALGVWFSIEYFSAPFRFTASMKASCLPLPDVPMVEYLEGWGGRRRVALEGSLLPKSNPTRLRASLAGFTKRLAETWDRRLMVFKKSN